MAKQQVVTYNYTCDVGGEVIPESEAGTAAHRISWEGSDYVLDVCAVHAAELDGILTTLKSFVAAGTKASGRRGRGPRVAAAPSAPRASRGRRASAPAASGGKRSDLSAVRAWARATGRPVSERGRVPAALLAAYDAAQNGAPSAALSDEPAAAQSPAATPRKRGGGRRPAAAKSSPRRANLGAVRSWARDNGYTVSERGRIPATLLAAYEAAHNGASPASSPAPRKRGGGRRKTAATA